MSPTASLDTESEKIVSEALERLMKGRTVIIITHRLNTILTADKIFVIKEGIVAEEGTHKSLLANGCIYAELYRIQDFSQKNIEHSKIVPELNRRYPRRP